MEAVFPSMITAVVGPLLLAWYGRRELVNRVGSPNGKGNLVQLTEKLLTGQAAQDERLASLERGLNNLKLRYEREHPLEHQHTA